MRSGIRVLPIRITQRWWLSFPFVLAFLTLVFIVWLGYQIFQNGSILKNNLKILSDSISLDFSAIAGIYNITLIIHDYSGNVAQSSTIIILLQQSSSSSPSSTITQVTSATHSSRVTQGVPGFTYLLTLFTIVVLALAYNNKRFKTK